jgi:hypothetical protein
MAGGSEDLAGRRPEELAAFAFLAPSRTSVVCMQRRRARLIHHTKHMFGGTGVLTVQAITNRTC